MRKLFTLALLSAATFVAQAQDVPVKDTSYWKLSGVTGLNMSQATLKNWVAGGENSVAFNLYLNGSLNYQKDNWAWTNDLVLQYGQIKTKSDGWQKSSDKISLTSKLGYKIKNKWYYSALFDYNTIFAKGYASTAKTDYIARFMAPAYVNLALGVDYKPNSYFSAFYSPLTLNGTLVTDKKLSDAGAYGVDAGKKSKFSLGSLLRLAYKKEVAKNVDIVSTFDAFTPYSSDFGNVNMNWDILANFKINKALTATLNTTFRYYDAEKYLDVDTGEFGPRLQIKNIFGLGGAYKF